MTVPFGWNSLRYVYIFEVMSSQFDLTSLISCTMQRIDYHSDTGRSKAENLRISKSDRIGTAVKQTHSTFNTTIEVPSIAPTDVDNSKVCKVRYLILVSAAVVSAHVQFTHVLFLLTRSMVRCVVGTKMLFSNCQLPLRQNNRHRTIMIPFKRYGGALKYLR